jgi:radical SAM-linked protein
MISKMTDPNQPMLFPLLIRFAKTGLMRFVGHLDWQAMQQAMFLRAGLPMGLGEGPTHKLKMKTSPPTPVGVASRAEFTYLLLAEPVQPDEAARRLSGQCPEGIEIVAAKDAGFMVRRNPFSTIEAASYHVEFGDGVLDERLGEIIAALEMMSSPEAPESENPDEIKGFWGRVLEAGRRDDTVNLVVRQMEGDTFHGAKCAAFLQDRLSLPHFPIFTKLDYYRLKPSRRRLFRQ